VTAPTEGEHRHRVGGRRRSVARLAAVQALYQIEANREVDPRSVVREFVRHRFDQEIEGDRLGEADPELFADIVCGVTDDRERLDTEISAALTEDWPLSRLDSVLRAILRAGAYELVHRPDVPPGSRSANTQRSPMPSSPARSRGSRTVSSITSPTHCARATSSRHGWHHLRRTPR